MSDWRDLFESAAAGEAGQPVSFRVVRRRGHDLLVLPMNGAAAAKAMTLYPAQRPFARLAKTLLRATLATGLPVPLPRETITLAESDPLTAWLQEISGTAEPATLAILAGNPAAAGRRFVILAFRGHDSAAVLKLGADPAARVLIDHEAAFLQEFAATYSHLPRMIGSRQTERWSGLALDYLDGVSPPPEATTGVREVLASWIDQTPPVPLSALPPWARLVSVLPTVSKRLVNATVTPVLFHGDFAPWNVRVSLPDGRWTVLDWESGQPKGVPGWDWFHWLIEVSILVHRHDTGQSAAFLADALQAPDFQAYAQAAQIAGLEQALLAAYLCYMREFLPSCDLTPSIAKLCQATATWLS